MLPRPIWKVFLGCLLAIALDILNWYMYLKSNWVVRLITCQLILNQLARLMPTILVTVPSTISSRRNLLILQNLLHFLPSNIGTVSPSHWNHLNLLLVSKKGSSNRSCLPTSLHLIKGLFLHLRLLVFRLTSHVFTLTIVMILIFFSLMFWSFYSYNC